MKDKLIPLSDLIAELSAAVASAGGQAQFAQKAKVSQAYVNDLLAGKRTPGKKILAVLGYEKTVMYRKAGQ